MKKNHAGKDAMIPERFTFGPVPSRRLGRSLGIDLVPLKTCSYDCLYCQLGRTTNKTVERREWVGHLEAIISEVRQKLKTRPEYITLSGSGEPTLYSRIGELIKRIHGITDIPVAVLTNGSLLWKKTVRYQIANADLVIPSLDAGDAAMFAAVNRPHPGIEFEQMLEGLKAFRQECRGAYWLEILLLGGYTAIPSEVEKLVNCTSKINPDRVQLNTVTRPPAEEFAASVNKTRLQELARLFAPAAEVIADFDDVRHSAEVSTGPQDIISLLKRRPCRAGDIASGLAMHRNEVAKHLEHYLAQGKLEQCRIRGEVYYRPAAVLEDDKKPCKGAGY